MNRKILLPCVKKPVIFFNPSKKFALYCMPDKNV